MQSGDGARARLTRGAGRARESEELRQLAKSTTNQGAGDRGELSPRTILADCGLDSSEIKPDFGDDFFVFCQSGDCIEPLSILCSQGVLATRYDGQRLGRIL